jgi:feruloyl-CoA synthase
MAATAPNDFWNPVVKSQTREDGSILVWRDEPLGPYPRCITERFFEWVHGAPTRIWMAERDAAGGWAETTYGEAGARILAIGACILSHGLSEDRPLLILSENSVAHALMALGAQHVGVPSAAISPAYSLASEDLGKLRDIAGQLTPGMIFADDAERFAPAIQGVFGADIPVIAVNGDLSDRTVLRFSEVIDTAPGPEVDEAHRAVTPDTVAKFLFTSGTTGSPKAVIQTQRLICSNQAMIASCYTYMAAEPPVFVDWAPWNHTASGNMVFNMAIYRGGTFYIDDGRPTPSLIGKTVRNLREIAPTWYFNVPLGYQMLLDAMETDELLRKTFFSRLKIMMYAGAGMSQPVWDRISRAAAEVVPGGVLLATGFGSTETGPFSMMCTTRQETAGNLGVPAPGVTLKLVPQQGKFEARVKGPSITPGYWRAPKLTKDAFDDEGFYCFGDAFRFADPQDPAKGFYFDGRLAENFKLASGTWVAVGALRARLINDLDGLASDAVIAGEDRTQLGALVVPDWARLREIADDPSLDGEVLLNNQRVRRAAAERLEGHAARATGSANRVTRLFFLDMPLSFAVGEVTDKGTINQRAVLRNRQDLVDLLWSEDPRVIAVAGAAA